MSVQVGVPVSPSHLGRSPQSSPPPPEEQGVDRGLAEGGVERQRSQGRPAPGTGSGPPQGAGPASPHSPFLGELGARPQGQRMSVSTASEKHLCRNTWRPTLHQAPGSGSLGSSQHIHRANILAFPAVCFVGQHCTESYKHASSTHKKLLRCASTSSRGIRATEGSGEGGARLGGHRAHSEVAGTTGRKHGVRPRTLRACLSVLSP